MGPLRRHQHNNRQTRRRVWLRSQRSNPGRHRHLHPLPVRRVRGVSSLRTLLVEENRPHSVRQPPATVTDPTPQPLVFRLHYQPGLRGIVQLQYPAPTFLQQQQQQQGPLPHQPTSAAHGGNQPYSIPVSAPGV